MPAERLQKILSNAGHSSRRLAERLILDGRVAVNGVIVRTLGSRADPERDEITVDGVPVLRGAFRYFMLNKPPGFVTTSRDDQGRPTVIDLVPIGGIQLHPVGRLDLDSEGLVILTTDGHLTNLLTHPRHVVDKEYLVAIDRRLSETETKRLVRGIEVDGERLRAASLRPTLPPEAGLGEVIPAAGGWLLVVLREGRNRELRRLLGALDRQVILLRRIRIGPLVLGVLGSGAFRELTDEEVQALYATATAAPGHPRPAAVRPGAPGAGVQARRRLPRAIAIDGPAASGKTTVGQALARRFGYLFLDTGLMYRAFALAAAEAGIAPADSAACEALADRLRMEVLTDTETRILLDGHDVTGRLREPTVEASVSAYSAIPGVRRVMVERQRAIARGRRAVLAGRDIGTVVLPRAPLKIFLEASEAARAERRALQTKGWSTTRDARQSLDDIVARDSVDSGRPVSPLEPAPDAVRIDTTTLALPEVIARVIEEVECARG